MNDARYCTPVIIADRDDIALVPDRDEIVPQRVLLIGAFENRLERALNLPADLRNLEARLAQLGTGEIFDFAGGRDFSAQSLVERAQIRNGFGNLSEQREFLIFNMKGLAQTRGDRNQAQEIENFEGFEVDILDIQFL